MKLALFIIAATGAWLAWTESVLGWLPPVAVVAGIMLAARLPDGSRLGPVGAGQMAGIEPALAGLTAMLAMEFAGEATFRLANVLPRLFLYGMMGYMLHLALSMSRHRPPGQAVYNMVAVGAMVTGGCRLLMGMVSPPPGAVPEAGAAALQGMLGGALLALPELASRGHPPPGTEDSAGGRPELHEETEHDESPGDEEGIDR